MAIAFSGNLVRAFSTPTSFSRNWYGQTQATQMFTLRIDAAVPPSIPPGTVSMLINKVLFGYYHSFYPSAGPTVLLRPVLTGNAGIVSRDIYLSIGVVYPIIFKWDGVNKIQKMLVAGIPTIMGNLAGATVSNASALSLGLQVAGEHVALTLDRVIILDGYISSGAEDQAYLNNADPTTIGTTAPWCAAYTLSGTTGQPAAIGDPGLQNAIDGTYNFASASGTGSAVYAPSLVWAPTVTAHPYVATSGKIIAATLVSNLDGTLQIPTQLLTTPRLTVNGTDLGPLVKPWLSGYHQCVFYATPGSYQINPGDVVSLSAPAAWCNTAAGSVGALAGTIPNHAGASAVGSDTSPRTLRMGVNNNLAPTLSGLGFSFPFKNFKRRMDAWPPGNHGKINQNVTRRVAISAGNDSLADGAGPPATLGYPGAIGKWLVVWDADNPVAPTIATMVTDDATYTAVTQHPELASNGTGGVGMCRVADFQHVSPTGPATIVVCVNLTDPSGTPHYSNLWIFAPGDWSIVDGVAVYDRSDALALSATYLDRLTDQVGTLRWVDSSACGGNPASFPYPELLNSVNDETWGENSWNPIQYGFSAVGPVNVAATPWIYSPLLGKPGGVGETFTATLAQNIATTPAVGTNEVYTFPDAATAPLMAGLEILSDAEVMRIIRVSGTSVTLYRGSNGTTPATHSAGAVTVYGRRSIRSVVNAGGGVTNNITWQLTTSTPHGITAGNGFNMLGWTGPAGSGRFLTWSDGTRLIPVDFVRTTWVTGPNTLFSTCGLFGDGRAPVLTATQTLDPATNYSQYQYISGIPYEAIASATGRYPHASIHVNVPMDACDDMVYTIARRTLNNFPAGRKVYVEYMNEPWNTFFTGYGYLTTMGPVVMPGWPVMYRGQVNQLADYVYRAAQVHTIFRSVFTAAGRGAEVQGLLNLQLGDDPHRYLDFAAAQSFTVDAIAEAPYLGMENTEVNSAAINGYDDDQAIDMWIHDLYYNTRTYNAWLATARAGIANYNAATGNHCTLMAYECGASTIPPQLASTVHVVERNHDMLYNPNFRVAEQDSYYWFQTSGFTAAHVYSISQYWNPEGWGMYHGLLQPHGRGDGSDSKADNRLYRANPDVANYKGRNVNQDDRCVSVRGQAFIDWLAGFDTTSTAGAAGLLLASDVTAAATMVDMLTAGLADLVLHDDTVAGTGKARRITRPDPFAATKNGGH